MPRLRIVQSGSATLVGREFELSGRSRGEVVRATGFDPRDCPEEPGDEEAPREFGVYAGGGHVLVGDRAEIEGTPSCRLSGWGLDCEKTVKDAAGALSMLAGPFATHAQAVEAYCGMLDRSSIHVLPLAAGTVAQVSGARYHIDNAPGCP